MLDVISIKNYLDENKMDYKYFKDGLFAIRDSKRSFFINTKERNYEKIFNFGNSFVDKKEFEKVFEKMDENIFENIKKIYILEDGKDFSKVKCRNPIGNKFSSSYQGGYMRTNGDIYINLPVIRKFTREILKTKGVPFLKDTFLREYNFYVFDTIIHECTHAHRENILYDYSEDEKSEIEVLKESMQNSMLLKQNFHKMPIAFR